MRCEVASLITALTEGNGENEDSLEANFSAPGWVEPGTYAGREERSGRIILHSVVGGMDGAADRGVCGGRADGMWLGQMGERIGDCAGFWGRWAGCVG